MNDEPNQIDSAGDATTPLWLVVVFGLVLYGALLYLDQNAGGFNAQVYAPYQSIEQLGALQPAKGEAGAYEHGRQVYMKTCAACHQASGKGTPGQFPPLIKTDWVLEADPGRMIRIVLNGLQGPIEVNGQPFNNVMMPWKDVLNDEEIASVITYVRQNKEWGNNASEVKPEQVKAIREKIKADSQPFTVEKLKAVPPGE